MIKIKWTCFPSITNRISLAFLFAAAISLFSAVPSPAEFSCVKCHSKRPGALAMHEAVKGRDCFTCHVRGEKLRQKGGIPPEKHEAFLKQRLEDPRCTGCHHEKNPEAVKQEPAKKPMAFSGSTYCPKCKIKGGNDWRMCPKCGGSLIDLDKTMRESALNHSHKICRQCHIMEGTLLNNHIEKSGEEFDGMEDCLECHKGHSECGECHK